MANPNIIGLAGPAGSGKTTIADAMSVLRYRRQSFATPIHNMLLALLASRTTDARFREIKGPLKETDVPELGGRSYRYAAQTLGTEWGRDLISSTLWVDSAMAWVSRTNGNVVFDDVRFASEAAAIREAGGVVILLSRDDLVPVRDHGSEKIDFPVDDMVRNRYEPRFVAELVVERAEAAIRARSLS